MASTILRLFSSLWALGNVRKQESMHDLRKATCRTNERIRIGLVCLLAFCQALLVPFKPANDPTLPLTMRAQQKHEIRLWEKLSLVGPCRSQNVCCRRRQRAALASRRLFLPVPHTQSVFLVELLFGGGANKQSNEVRTRFHRMWIDCAWHVYLCILAYSTFCDGHWPLRIVLLRFRFTRQRRFVGDLTTRQHASRSYSIQRTRENLRSGLMFDSLLL